jgi:hypothetical protein
MVMRGPTYPWVDFAESDGDTEEMERMLSQIFTDREVLAFFLEIGGTWMRRRNRFKHFYAWAAEGAHLSGQNVREDGQFRPSRLRVHRQHQRRQEPALQPGEARGTVADPATDPRPDGVRHPVWTAARPGAPAVAGAPARIQALTGRDADASSHSDYLARTHGQAICVCNEPDSSSQVLMTEKVKMMVSDSDNLSVRHLYGTTRDMPIMWKLVMLCNTPPRFSQLDAAAVERTQFVPCTSTFVGEAEAPSSEAEQYRQGRFVRRDIPPTRQRELARRLMAMFFAAYCRHGMHRPAYALRPPARIRLESAHQLQELSVFRMYLRAFLRPSGTLPESMLSLVAHRAAGVACQTILDLHGQWLRRAGNEGLSETAWHRLPEAARDPCDVGSPGWVRCQCVHLFHFVRNQSGCGGRVEPREEALAAQDHWTLLTIPYVDAAFVADQFNRYRRQHRVFLNRPLTNGVNTFEGANPAGEAAENGARGRGGHCVSLDARMRLDKNLVRNVMREVTGTDPDGDRFVGRVFMGPNNTVLTDNDSQTGIMLDRVLAYACRWWFRRFRAPLAHPALVTRSTMHRCVQAVIRRTQLPTERPEDGACDTTDIADDWDKMANAHTGTVLTDDEVGDHFPEEAVLYRYAGRGQPSVAVKRYRRTEQRVRQRTYNQFRSGPCFLFPTADVPEPLVHLPTPDQQTTMNPIEWSCPRTTDEAESLMVTESFWGSVEHKQMTEHNRITTFRPASNPRRGAPLPAWVQ